jgi:hypothetical protein
LQTIARKALGRDRIGLAAQRALISKLPVTLVGLSIASYDCGCKA